MDHSFNKAKKNLPQEKRKHFQGDFTSREFIQIITKSNVEKRFVKYSK